MESFFRRAVGLRFGDYTIQELIAIGSYKVVFSVGDQVIKILKEQCRFAVQIEEFPLPFVSQDGKPAYNLDTLNAKLSRLASSPYLCEITPEYETIRDNVIDSLYKLRTDPNEFRVLDAMGAMTCSSAVERQLRVLAQDDTDRRVARAAKKASRLLRRIKPDILPVAHARDLVNNPLLVWSAAHLNGFFTSDELPEAARYVRSAFALKSWMFEQGAAVAACLAVLHMEDAVSSYLDCLSFFLGDSPVDWRSEVAAVEQGFGRCGAKIEVTRRERQR